MTLLSGEPERVVMVQFIILMHLENPDVMEVFEMDTFERFYKKTNYYTSLFNITFHHHYVLVNNQSQLLIYADMTIVLVFFFILYDQMLYKFQKSASLILYAESVLVPISSPLPYF